MVEPTANADEEARAAYFLFSAGAHYDGAKTLALQAGFGREDRDYFPVYLLLCNSLELALKAYLLHAGVKECKLKTKYRHDLRKGLRHAVARGLPKKDTAYLVDKLDPIHGGNLLRYCKPGIVKLGDMSRAFEIMDDLFEDVGRAIGPFGVLAPNTAA